MIYKTNSGYGVNFNQIFEKGNFPSATGITAINGTRTVSDNVLTFTATTWYGGVYINTGINAVNGHKYLFLYELKTDATTSVNAGFGYGSTFKTTGLGAITNSWNYYGSITTISGTDTYLYIYLMGGGNITPNGNCYARNCMVFDLTQMFGLGNEPTTVAEFREMYPDDYYDYTLSNWQWSKKGKITSYPTPVIENGTTLLPIEHHIVGLAHYNDGNTDIIYNYAKRELPVGFVQLDYIESTGTQYIDTGYIPNQDTKVDIKVMLRPNLTSGNYCIFSGRTYLSMNSYSLFFLIIQNSVARFDYDDTQLSFNIDFSSLVNTDLEIFTDKNKCYFNGVLKTQANYSEFTSAYPMLIGASYADGVNNNFACMRTYFCKIYDNDTLVRNYIPCYRYSDGIEGLYDTVNKQFYTNQGTGRFLRGKEIDSGNLLDLSKFTRGYPGNTAFENTTKRTFTKNTYVVGLSLNNYYAAGNSSITINEQSMQVYSVGGYGCAFALDLNKNKKYKAYWSGNSVQGIYLMYYSADGTFISYTNIGSNGENRVEFTTLSDFGYVLLDFVATNETTATFSNISLHEVN